MYFIKRVKSVITGVLMFELKLDEEETKDGGREVLYEGRGGSRSHAKLMPLSYRLTANFGSFVAAA